MDNFEWTDGYNIGITYINYQNNLTRHIKDSGDWYSALIKTFKNDFIYYYWKSSRRFDSAFSI